MKNSFWLFGSHHYVITDPCNTDLEYDQVEKKSKPGVKTPPHIHGDYTELVYVIEGQMTVHTKEGSIALNSGQHFFIPKECRIGWKQRKNKVLPERFKHLPLPALGYY
jgi:quercetin dioxygenase-like cupin family protein